MASISGPAGDLCAGVNHQFEVVDAANCLTIEWKAQRVPDGVSLNDVVFSAPYSLITDITVPVDGSYYFTAICCQAA